MNKIGNIHKKLDKLSIKLLLEGQGFFNGKKNIIKKNIGKYGIKLFSQYRKNPRPLISTFAITNRCPWACKYCSRGMRLGAQDIPLDILKKTIEYLKDIGTPIYAFTGGEPLLRKELLEILDFVHPYHAQIYTTGFGMTKEIAREIARKGNIATYISILSGNKEKHDLFKGRAGAYNAGIRAIELLKNARAYVGVATVTSKDLIKEGLIKFLIKMKKLGVDQVLLFEPKVTGGALYNTDWILSKEESDMVASLHNLQKKRDDVPIVFSFPFVEGKCMMGCCAGFARVYIDAEGNVCPCDFLPLSFGNVKQEKFEAVWKKMNFYFSKPGSSCFINTNYKKIRELNEGKLPLSPETSIAICKNIGQNNIYPKLYGELGFDPDLAILHELGLI